MKFVFAFSSLQYSWIFCFSSSSSAAHMCQVTYLLQPITRSFILLTRVSVYWSNLSSDNNSAVTEYLSQNNSCSGDRFNPKWSRGTKTYRKSIQAAAEVTWLVILSDPGAFNQSNLRMKERKRNVVLTADGTRLQNQYYKMQDAPWVMRSKTAPTSQPIRWLSSKNSQNEFRLHWIISYIE